MIAALVRETPQPRVVMMQPTFLPWQGMFALLAAADVAIFLDNFQFSRQSWQQRNRLFVGGSGVGWISVPIDRHGGTAEWPTLQEARPVLEPFRKKFLASLSQTYGKTPFGRDFVELTRTWITADWQNLADMNIAFIERVATLLHIGPRFVRSSHIGFSGVRSAAVLDLLRRVSARTYFAAQGAFGYMRDDGLFPQLDIDVLFQDFVPEAYPQQHQPTFVPYLSVLDALCQVGAAETRVLVESGQRRFVPWTEMCSHTDAGQSRPVVTDGGE